MAAGTVIQGVRWIADAAGRLVGYRNPITDKDEDAPLQSLVTGGGNSVAVALVAGVGSAASNAALLQAAHDALIGTGGEIILPKGLFHVTGNIDTNAGRTGDYLGASVTWTGAGMGATTLVMTNTSGALFKKTSGHAHAWRCMSIKGPGTGTESVGIDWLNAAGGAKWEDLWIEGFGCGTQFWDATSMTFVNCHWHANGVNKRLGYNCDIFQYFGGRIQNSTGHGMHIGWRGPTNQAGSMLCSPVLLTGVRFGDCGNSAIHIDDTGASQITVDSGYFEYNAQVLTVGTVGTQQSAKQVTLRKCFFTRPQSFSGLQIEVKDANSDCSLEVLDCTSDATYTGTFMRIGATGSLRLKNSRIPVSGGSGKTFQIGTGATYVVNDGEEYGWNTNDIKLADGTLLATSTPAQAVRMTNGTGKTFAEWSRRSSSTGALVGTGHAYVADVNGQWVGFDGALRFLNVTTPPAASATYRGWCVRVDGGAGVADKIVMCMKSAADTYAWRDVFVAT